VLPKSYCEKLLAAGLDFRRFFPKQKCILSMAKIPPFLLKHRGQMPPAPLTHAMQLLGQRSLIDNKGGTVAGGFHQFEISKTMTGARFWSLEPVRILRTSLASDSDECNTFFGRTSDITSVRRHGRTELKRSSKEIG